MRLAANFALRRESAIVRLLFFLAPLITLIAPLTTVPVLVVLSAGCIALALLNGAKLTELFRFDLALGLLEGQGWTLACALDDVPSEACTDWLGIITIIWEGKHCIFK